MISQARLLRWRLASQRTVLPAQIAIALEKPRLYIERENYPGLFQLDCALYWYRRLPAATAGS